MARREHKKKRRAARPTTRNSQHPVPDFDHRNDGLPVGATPSDKPTVIVKSSQYDPNHPLLKISDVQDIIDESRSISRKLERAHEVHQQHLDVSRRELEVQRETRAAVEKLLTNSDRVVASNAETLGVLKEILVTQKRTREDMHALMSFFIEKKTNGNGDHTVEPDHDAADPLTPRRR